MEKVELYTCSFADSTLWGCQGSVDSCGGQARTSSSKPSATDLARSRLNEPVGLSDVIGRKRKLASTEALLGTKVFVEISGDKTLEYRVNPYRQPIPAKPHPQSTR